VGRSTSTGVVSLDAALGGPLPSGAIEIYGESSSGKTTLLYEIIATAQKSGMQAALCPSEYLDIPYMKKIGVDLDGLILITGNCGEDALDGALSFLWAHRNTGVVLAVDSATSLRPERDGAGDWTFMLDEFLGRALDALGDKSCVVLVNQVRVKRSVDPAKFFVDGEVSSTAKKILDLFTLRLELSRNGSRDGEHEIEVNIVASTVSKPATVVYLPVVPGEGINTMKDLLQFGLALGVVTQAGAWYSIGATGPNPTIPLGCGIREAVHYLETHYDMASYLLDLVMMKA
jgi:recombination protein RecA